MKDTQFMSAAEKNKVLTQWEHFLESGCSRQKFTKSLYQHLINHCSFIAHYDINGFYGCYFIDGEDTVRFLSQFDNSNGIPKSCEYGMTYWYTDPEYNDLNSAMCQVASKYLPALIQEAKEKQVYNDVQRARELLDKHGMTATITQKKE